MIHWKCTTTEMCECPHCVDYSKINLFTQQVKEASAARAYSDDVFGKIQKTWILNNLLNFISYTVLKLSIGALDKNRDLFLEWIVNNIASQRLLDKIIRMVENQNENIKEFMKNKYSRACGNSHHPLDQVKRIFKNISFFFI